MRNLTAIALVFLNNVSGFFKRQIKAATRKLSVIYLK